MGRVHSRLVCTAQTLLVGAEPGREFALARQPAGRAIVSVRQLLAESLSRPRQSWPRVGWFSSLGDFKVRKISKILKKTY